MASPIQSLRRLTRAAVALLLSRVEFASLELARTRAQLLRWFLRGLLAMVLLLMALFAATAWLVALLWPAMGPWALLPFALVYGAIAAALLNGLSREIDNAPAPLQETLQQLSEDRAAIFGTTGASAAGARMDEESPR